MTTMQSVFQGDLDQVTANKFAGVKRIAWDIETSGLDPQSDRIGTVQLHAPELGSLIVKVGGQTPTYLCALLKNPRIVKVFHHAMFDLRFMVERWDAKPVNVACTKVASKLLNRSAAQRHTLQALLVEFLGVSISKDEQQSDWLRADLSQEQIAYAYRDVEYLIPLLDKLASELRHAGLAELYEACLRFIPTRVVLDLGHWPDIFSY